MRSAGFALTGLMAIATLAAAEPVERTDPAVLSTAELQAFVNGDLGPVGGCATPYVLALDARNAFVDPVAFARADSIYSYFTTDGNFMIEYSITGSVAVDSTDADLSGTPDYVEQVASAFERSWAVEIDSLGFAGPDISVSPYHVNLRYGGSAYGYMQPNGQTLVIHANMGSFCTGDANPDECTTNLLISTIAHEFKHASQYAAGWELGSIPRWAELDATWIEDLVFDDSNDYYRFINTQPSPFLTPTGTLLGANYEHCTWHHFLSETYGAQYLLDLEHRIAANPLLAVQRHYPLIAATQPANWPELWGDYTLATYLTGARAVSGLGFEEASAYPQSTVQPIATLPAAAPVNGSLADLAMQFFEFNSAQATSTGRLNLAFSGNPAVAWTLRVVFQRADATEIVNIPVVGGTAVANPDPRIEDYDRVCVVLGNSRVPASVAAAAGTFTLDLGLNSVPVTPQSLGGMKGRFRRAN